MRDRVKTVHGSPATRELIVLGFFPPPVTGQALLTSQFAEHMERHWTVRRVNLSPRGNVENVRWRTTLSPARVRHYLGIRSSVMQALEASPEATVVWPAISPSLFGHLRDLTCIAPGFRASHRLFGVVHWGSFHRLFESVATRRTALGLVKRLDGLVFNTEQLAARCSNWLPEGRSFVMPNTVGRDMLVTEGEWRSKIDQGARTESMRVLFLSNMIRSKGYLDVLEALQILKDSGTPFSATFAGGWESQRDRSEFAALVQRYDLDQAVEHLGLVTDRSLIRTLFLAADVFVLPTYYPTEAQPLAVIEALNAATPVVATRHASIPTMIDGENDGLFVEARDPQSVAQALTALSDRHRWSRIAAGARARFDRQFHPDVVIAEWNRLLSAAD